MTATGDELAGVVDLFGALTREELSQALTELAFKQGAAVDDAAVTDAIETATVCSSSISPPQATQTASRC